MSEQKIEQFKEGKYFYLTTKVLTSEIGIYKIDKVDHNHYSFSGSFPSIWIIAHNIETNKPCEFAIESAFESYCIPHIRQNNLDILLHD